MTKYNAILQQNLDEIRKRIERLQKFKDAFSTPAGKLLSEYLEEKRNIVVSQFALRDLSDLNVAQTIILPYITRGKLQIIREIQNDILNTENELARLQTEYEELMASTKQGGIR